MESLHDKITQSYIDDVLVRLAHHSSALEGNKISLAETATIILDQTLPNNSKITNREYFEVLNHEQAFELLLNNVRQKVPLSISVIKDIHAKITDRLQYDSGEFKKSSNYIRGAEFETDAPQDVPILLSQLIENLEYRIEISKDNEDIVKAILEFHISFEKIHPFSDGNGRVGRLILNYSLLENDLPFLVIKKEDKSEYNSILHEGQTKLILESKDIERFYELASPLLAEEHKRLISFYEQEEQKVKNEDLER